MRDKDILDQLIDASLATYGDTRTDYGLEERVMRGVERRLANAMAPRHRRWLAWSAALAAASCILALIFFSNRPAVGPINNAHQAGTQEKPRSSDSDVANNPTTATGIRRSARAAKGMGNRTKPPASTETSNADRLPKQDVFPTPAPLDERVETLAFFVRRAPASEVKELLANQAQLEEPLAFQELEIPPLEPLDKGGR